MAKKNKQKASGEKAAAVPEGRTASGAKANVAEAFASGNYAAVLAFAKSDNSDATKKLVAMTKIDRAQVAAGLFALLVVLTVAFFTLH